MRIHARCNVTTFLLASAFLLGALLPANRADAVVVFAQEPVAGAIGASSDATLGQRIADDFTVSHAAAVNHVRWWGLYFMDRVVADDFSVRFYLDTGGGTPYTFPIYSVSPATVSRNPTGIKDQFGFEIYEYAASLPGPFAANAGAPHYLSVVNETSSGEWIWHASEPGVSFFRGADDAAWSQSSEPNLAFRLSEPPQIGPQLDLSVRDFLDVNPPLPPPVEIDVVQSRSGPSELMTLLMQSAMNASGARVPFGVDKLAFSHSGDVAAVEFLPSTGTIPDETFFELMLDLALSDGAALDLIHLRDFNVLDPSFFSVWFQTTGKLGMTTHHALFQSQGGEFFDVSIGEPGSALFPVSFGVRGDPRFTLTVTASQQVPEPVSVALLLAGLAMGWRRRSK